MKIKHQNHLSEELAKILLDFCVKSKPYDFCGSGSPSMRRMKILEYLAELRKNNEFFSVEQDGELLGGAIFSIDKQNNVVTLEIAFTNSGCVNSYLIKAWGEIIDLVFEMWPDSHIEGEIQRTYKKSNFINWIKRYDTRCQINNNMATWNK